MGELAVWAACVSQLLGSALPIPPGTWPEHARRVVGWGHGGASTDEGEIAELEREVFEAIDGGFTSAGAIADALGWSQAYAQGRLQRMEARGLVQRIKRGQWQRTGRD